MRTRDRVDPVEAASAVGLRYVTDEVPGITRTRRGRGFTYRSADGSALRDADALGRIRSLGIPPAWTAVWICPDPRGHIQATGRDARVRKQYRYHRRWHEVRDQAKFGRLLVFARALPRIRAATERDLRRPGLPREKVLAVVVRLLEATLIRVGNEEYARTNRSFGLTTLKNRHVVVGPSNIRFRFRGKSGKDHEVDLADARLSRIVARCQDLPGQQLFQYLDEHGRRRTVGSQDVNDYLKEVAGSGFTAKDFRTWAGTVIAAWALREGARSGPPARPKRQVVRAIETVARRLGNTPAISRRCYVHPAVIESYADGTLVRMLSRRRRGLAVRERLRPEERAVVRLLKRATLERDLAGG